MMEAVTLEDRGPSFVAWDLVGVYSFLLRRTMFEELVEAVEMGERAPVLLDELGIHAVDAEHNDAWEILLRTGDAAARKEREPYE